MVNSQDIVSEMSGMKMDANQSKPPCTSSSLSPVQGNTTAPISSLPAANRDLGFRNGLILKGVEGGSSICRDEDPLPPSVPIPGMKLLQADASLNTQQDAPKVFVECPERTSDSRTPQADGQLPTSDVFRPVPAPSFAEIVKNKSATISGLLPGGPLVGSRLSDEANNQNRSFHDGKPTSALGQIIEIEGRRVVSFSCKELEELAAPFEFTLVGKFSHGFPTMKVLKSIMGNLNLRGAFSVALLEQKHVLIRLSCEEDFTRLWSRQVWFMAGFPMRVLKWTPDFDPLVEAPFAPVWVLFPYLPVHLYDQRSLFQIASALGKPLRIDSATANLTRASTPRVCIEIDVTEARLSEVEIRLGEKIKMQQVEYENIPSYCSFCKHLGHSLKDCRSFNKASDPVFGDNSLGSPLKEVEVTVTTQRQTSCQNSPPKPFVPLHLDSVLDGSISLDSKGMITFNPGCNDPLNNPMDVSKIRNDLSQSYDDFSDGSEDFGSPAHSFANYEFFNPYAFVDKNNYSDGDFNPVSEPIILPPKKKSKKKSKKNIDNPNPVEERVELLNNGSTEEVESFNEVVRKNKKKKGKEITNPD